MEGEDGNLRCYCERPLLYVVVAPYLLCLRQVAFQSHLSNDDVERDEIWLKSTVGAEGIHFFLEIFLLGDE